MTDETSKKVAERFMEKEAMAVVVRSTAGHDWGWFSREDPRMHIQTVDSKARRGRNKARVWLEHDGRRIFDVDLQGQLSAKDVRALEAKVQAERESIEDQWCHFMAENGWLKASVEGHLLKIEAYPSHHGYTREVDLRRQFPGAFRGQNTWLDSPPLVDIDRTNGLIAIGHDKALDRRNHINPAEFLFV